MERTDFELLLEYAKRSAAAYNNAQDIKAVYGGDNELTILELEEIEVLVFVEYDALNKTQWLVIRGSANLENAKLDAEILLHQSSPIGIPLHTGFSKCAHVIYEAVEPLLREEYEIRITGHSLGAAIAVILMMRLSHEAHYSLDTCYTFGQPKVTNSEGVREYQNLPLVRIMNDEDPVPLLPPFTILSSLHGEYKHLGEEVLLSSGEFKHYEEAQVERIEAHSLWRKLGQDQVSDHEISLYVERITCLAEDQPKK